MDKGRKKIEIFLKGVAFGEMLTKKMKLQAVQKAEKRKTIEVMGEDGERTSH